MSFEHESQSAAVMPSYLEKSFSIIKKGRGVLEKQNQQLYGTSIFQESQQLFKYFCWNVSILLSRTTFFKQQL